MGYESKIVVIDRREHEATEKHPAWVYGSEIARFDLGKMGYEKYPVNNYDDLRTFRDLFTVPIDFDLSVQNEDSNTVYPDEYWREDMYGEHCKYTTDIDSVIAWMERYLEHDDYRRAALFYDFLRVLKEHEDEYQQIVLVHYGY